MPSTPNPNLALLRAEYLALASECDAAHDGALHHAYGRAADRMVYALERRYDVARSAYLNARKGI